MLAWLRGRLARESAPAAQGLSVPTPEQMAWLAETSLPIPAWQAMAWPDEAAGEAVAAHENGVAAAWLDALAAALPEGHARAESPNFMLLSALQARPAGVLQDYLERSRRRVLATLPGIAADAGAGRIPVLVFADEDNYYRYVSHYGTGGDEPEGFSGGMFIHAGYGHFVFTQGSFETMEPVVVHELTHCLVSHLAIPAWLNEGLAVNTEQRFAPRPPRFRADELQYLFGRFWNADTIQEFWSGKSFLRSDDGQPLSYELAKLLVQLLDKDYALLARFCAAARHEDGGQQAAREVLGASLEELAGVVLGAGTWQPQPAAWNDGTEKGQF
jgi:hypothetical protein